MNVQRQRLIELVKTLRTFPVDEVVQQGAGRAMGRYLALASMVLKQRFIVADALQHQLDKDLVGDSRD
jgi:hypothetical protein